MSGGEEHLTLRDRLARALTLRADALQALLGLFLFAVAGEAGLAWVALAGLLLFLHVVLDQALQTIRRPPE